MTAAAGALSSSAMGSSRASRDSNATGPAGPVETRKGPSPRLIERAYDHLRAHGLQPTMTRLRQVRPGVMEIDLTRSPTDPEPPRTRGTRGRHAAR